MSLEDIAESIKKTPLKRKPIIIAIEGFGGAGKSTFAAKLKVQLGDAYVVAIDDFFLIGRKSDADKSNFDRDRLQRQVLLPVRNGQPAAYQKLIEATNTLSKPVKVPNVTYLIIEGVSSFHPDIADYMDYKIWIDTPGSVAKARMAKRDTDLERNDGQSWEHWTKTYQAYKDRYRPQDRADFVFSNSNSARTD